MPISPGLPPVAPPTARSAPPRTASPQLPALPVPQAPRVLRPPATARRPVPQPPPSPAARVRGRAPRSRYDWRVTRHIARPIEVVDEERHFLATFGWTTAWFAVPYALFALWTLTFPASPGTACARPAGNACPSPRHLALTTLVDSLPRVGVALGIALVIAGLIRLGSTAWRPVTAGFSAAIIGAGAATVLFSVLNSTG